MDPRALEERYLERARDAIAPHLQDIQLVAPDRLARPAPPGAILAGWWVDEAAASDRVLLPNPYDGLETIATMESWVWEVVQGFAPKLGDGLDAAAGRALRGAVYWRVMLAPWLVHLVSALADRRLFCRAVAELLPSVPLAVPDVPGPPASTAESVQRLRTDHGNAGLLATLAPHLNLHTIADEPPPASHAVPTGRPTASALARMLIALAPGAALALLPRRRLGLVGLTRLTPRQLVVFETRVKGLAPLPRPSARRATAERSARAPDPGARARLGLTPSADPLEQLAIDAIAQLLPVSLFEGYEEVQRESARRYGRRPLHVVVGNYSIDECQNEFLARCRTAGRRFAFSQHGGMYLQSPVNAQERLELGPDSVFWSWGADGTGVIPTPNPYLDQLRDSYRGGTRITIVEALEPPDAYVVRFAGHPLANQGYETRQMLADLVRSLPESRRFHLALKRFPSPTSAPARPDVLEAVPADGPAGGASGWMAASRLAVIPYLDTPFIEAMVIGTPTIGLWNPQRWLLRPDLEPLFERLREVGIFHSNAASAAAHIDRVYDDVNRWWTMPKVSASRAEFIARFAMPGDALAAWTGRLRELAR